MDSSYRSLAVLGLTLAGLWYAAGGANTPTPLVTDWSQEALKPRTGRDVRTPDPKSETSQVEIVPAGMNLDTEDHRTGGNEADNLVIKLARPPQLSPADREQVKRALDQLRKRRKIDLTNSGR